MIDNATLTFIRAQSQTGNSRVGARESRPAPGRGNAGRVVDIPNTGFRVWNRGFDRITGPSILDLARTSRQMGGMLIYKILRAGEWAALRDGGETSGAPIDVTDGYVHFSTAEQAAETAARHFAGAEGLMLLAYEAEALGPALKWEESRGGALFPHLYAPLRLDQMRWHAALPLVGGAHRFPPEMTWEDRFVDPERVQFEAFKALPREREINMLNLVRFRAVADYPEGHECAGLSGAEAYALYGQNSAPVLAQVGGEILWRGAFEATLIGPANDVWDAVFAVRYPDAGAFLAMVTDLDYQRAVVHRQAAVETSRLIRCAPAAVGRAFG